MQGDLMVCERNGMEKVYDLAERCLPGDVDTRIPTVVEYANWLFDTTLRAHGVVTWKQLLHLKTGKKMRDAMQRVLKQKLESGEIEEVSCNGAEFYVGRIKTTGMASNKNVIKILSPFDNAVIHRERLSALFDFDYRIECYVPEKKRVYGYFCLPVLTANRFAGRIDCKAHRAEGKFEVISLHLQDKLENKPFLTALKKEVQALADFNGCPAVMNYAV